jgi:CNT family concentrative nucleoside transporter
MQFISLCGVFVMLGICVALSRDRKAIRWRLVGVGLLLQALLGFVFLSWDAGNAALQACGRGVDAFLAMSQDGTKFVFGALVEQDRQWVFHDAESGEHQPSGIFVFAFMVLPTLIFFSSFMAVLYHVGVMQWVVRGMAWLMVRVLGTSGSESLSACANVFVGQTEAPLLVRPFLARMTTSELFTVMVGGFATIAGSVFALYVAFVGGAEPEQRAMVAGHLMVASVMAVPAGLVCSKVLWPETERSETFGRVEKTEDSPYGSVVEAAAAGAGDGLKLALNVGAMLIAFLGLVAVINAGMQWCSDGWSIQGLLSILFYPVAAVMGVPAGEIGILSELIGTKLVLTELVAFQELGEMKNAGDVSPHRAKLATIAGSVAIQVGGLGAMAPERRGDLAKIGLRAMFAGALATCMTACVAGVLASGSVQ